MHRRKYLSALSVPFAASLAGCQPDHPPIQRLAVRRVSSVRESGASWELTVVIANMSTIEGREGTFHDVMVLGFDADGNELYRQTIGDISTEFDINNGKEVQLECAELPHTIWVKARETPCNDETEILVRVYDGKDGNHGHTWSEHSLACGEDPPVKSQSN